MSLEFKFETACIDVKYLTKKPKDDELLRIYGLYKQALFGPNTTKKPQGLLSIKDQRKWEAWMTFNSLSQEEAKLEYINLVEKLKKQYN